MSKKSKTASFDFSLIGEETPLILEIPERKISKEEKPKEKPLPPKEEPKVSDLNLPVPPDQLPGWLSLDSLQAIFNKEVVWSKVKDWPSVKGYLESAQWTLNELYKIEANLERNKGTSKFFGSLLTLEKWMISYSRNLWMAKLLAESKKEKGILPPLDLTLLEETGNLAAEQRKQYRLYWKERNQMERNKE